MLISTKAITSLPYTYLLKNIDYQSTVNVTLKQFNNIHVIVYHI